MKIQKTKLALTLLGTAALTAFALTGSGMAVKAADGSFSEGQKKEIEAVIYDYLMSNPQVIFEAADKYKQNEEEMQARLFTKKFEEYKGVLTEGPYSPFIGAADADVVIVEFFDFNCGYCKKAFTDVQKLVDEDKNVKVVFKEMPILSPASRMMAEWSLAANKQGKYWEFHKKLMMHPGGKDQASLEMLARDIGLDVKQLKEDLKDPALKEAIDQNLKISREMGINGTPAFIIGDFLARGYMGYDSMKSTIATIRDEKG